QSDIDHLFAHLHDADARAAPPVAKKAVRIHVHERSGAAIEGARAIIERTESIVVGKAGYVGVVVAIPEESSGVLDVELFRANQLIVDVRLPDGSIPT